MTMNYKITATYSDGTVELDVDTVLEYLDDADEVGAVDSPEALGQLVARAISAAASDGLSQQPWPSFRLRHTEDLVAAVMDRLRVDIEAQLAANKEKP